MNHSIEKLSSPIAEVVSLAEAITQVNGVAGDDDIQLKQLIIAATATVEADAAIVLRSHVARVYFWDLKSQIEELEIPPTIWPITEIEAINYRNGQGIQTEYAANDWQAMLHSRPCLVRPNPNTTWPEMLEGYYDQLTIEATIGTPTPPEQAKQAILLLVGHWYLNREAAASGSIEAVSLAYQTLIDQLKLYRYP